MLLNTKIIYTITIVLFLWSCSTSTVSNISDTISLKNKQATVKTGLDVLLEYHIEKLHDKNIALVTNHSGIDKNSESNVSRFLTNDSIDLVKIFTPEHGFTGNIPDGEHIKYDSSPSSLPPIISLYGAIRKPTMDMFENIDLIIYDIQDIGTRFYTYISTLGLVMEAAGEANIPVIVLDRPNPIGEQINGPILDENYQSFIGKYPIPIQYGMTVGELTKMIIGEKMINSLPELTVIPMKNYRRDFFYDQTSLPWTNPSPNIPDLETAIIYPGICLFEATNVSEGRGTFSPFKQIGTPWIDTNILVNLLNEQNLPGVNFESAQFTPVSIATMSKYPKFENKNCNGIEINIANRDNYKSILTGITVLWAINSLYPESLVIQKDSMGRLWGSDNLYFQLQDGKTPSEIVNFYLTDLDKFMQIRKKYLIYD